MIDKTGPCEVRASDIIVSEQVTGSESGSA